MPRLTVVDPNHAQGRAKELLDRVGGALGVFTNYFNSVGQTEIDFPVVELPVAR